MIDDGLDAGSVLRVIGPANGRAIRVGVTGSAGAGKSTLIAALVRRLRGTGLTVAVLASDPQSPRSGGALLGDRIRMECDPADAGVFIRSFSTRGQGGGLSAATLPAAELVERFGFEVVLIESVGAGQDQVAIREVVDELVLVVTPESGDEVQWQKAGVIEVADVIVVGKADLPGADTTAALLRDALGGGRGAAIVKCAACRGEGVEELWRAVELKRRAHVEA
jgi:LAO/AO transport system kinase